MFKFIAGIFAGFGIVGYVVIHFLLGIPGVKEATKKALTETIDDIVNGEHEPPEREYHFKEFRDGRLEACYCRNTENHRAIEPMPGPYYGPRTSHRLRPGYQDLPKDDPRRS